MFLYFLALDLNFISHVSLKCIMLYNSGFICITLFPLHLIKKATQIEWCIFKKWEKSE